ncbi:MAG: GNAT family N-acetyltransferase [bacterium]|nr:GNAT family N-acetyltransferase [bacterium]
MKNITIREAQKDDGKNIALLATKIWEDDYLGRQFERWLLDGNFFIAEAGTRIVGCAKISVLPEKTGWLEGLRVDPEYQKMGIGREFNRFMVDRIDKMKNDGIIDKIEYSTYYKNAESLHMGFKAGFQIVEKFTVLSRAKYKDCKEIDPFRPSRIWFNDYKDYLPAGWKFVKNTLNGARYILEHCDFYKNTEAEFYAFRDERAFCFFEKNAKNIIRSIPFMNYLARMEIEILIPESWSDILPVLYDAGFDYWDEPKEPNVFILRKNDCV